MTKKIAVLENVIVKDPKFCLRGKKERGGENSIQEWRAWQENGEETELKVLSYFIKSLQDDRSEFWVEL